MLLDAGGEDRVAHAGSSDKARPDRLLDTLRQLMGAESMPSLLDTVRSIGRDVVGCDGISLVLRDGFLCHYAVEDATGPLWAGERVPADSRLSGWVMDTGSAAIIPDIFDDDRVQPTLYPCSFPRRPLERSTR